MPNAVMFVVTVQCSWGVSARSRSQRKARSQAGRIRRGSGLIHEDRSLGPAIPPVNFRDQKRRNATHRSIVDPDARLARKGDGKSAVLSHSGHVLRENRNGICVDVDVDQADGHAERRAAQRMLNRVWRNHKLGPSTLGTDKGYVDGAFLKDLEDCGITPHVPIDRPPRTQDEKAAAYQPAANGPAPTRRMTRWPGRTGSYNPKFTESTLLGR